MGATFFIVTTWGAIKTRITSGYIHLHKCHQIYEFLKIIMQLIEMKLILTNLLKSLARSSLIIFQHPALNIPILPLLENLYGRSRWSPATAGKCLRAVLRECASDVWGNKTFVPAARRKEGGQGGRQEALVRGLRVREELETVSRKNKQESTALWWDASTASVLMAELTNPLH